VTYYLSLYYTPHTLPLFIRFTVIH
jgi:hypothetical protein